MLSTRSSRWVAGTAGVCVLLAVGTWFLLVGPRRDHADALRAEGAQTRDRNDTLRLEIAQLRSQYAGLPAKKAELARVGKEFPAVADIPTLTRQFNSIAGGAGVVVTHLTPSTPAYVTDGTGAAGTAKPSGATVQLVAIPISLKVAGDYFQAAQFMKQLQTQMKRSFLITGVAIAAETGAASTSSTSSTSNATTGAIGLTITGQVYVLPDPLAGSAGAAGAAVAGATPGTTSGTPGTTPNGGTN